MTAIEHVILVDKHDNECGTAEKMAAHQLNLCHRAFSVFIYRQRDTLEILLQRRADNKYHSGGLWTNTCCSHPRPGEDVIAAGERRLKEEMGITSRLTSLGWFHYIAPFANGLTENEVDYVLVGTLTHTDFTVNPNEVQDYKWMSIGALKKAMQTEPEQFTPWLARALIQVEQNLKQSTE